MRRFLILAGYVELSMYLYLSGKLDQYINIRYTYLAFVAMILAFVLALVQLTLWVKQLDKTRQPKLTWGKWCVLALPIAVGLLVPTATLDARAVSTKGYTFPLAAGVTNELTSSDGTDIQYLRPDTSLYFTKSTYEKEMAKSLSHYEDLHDISITSDNYMEVMELIYRFPEQFVGKNLTYTGFVFRDSRAGDQVFLFRFGIIHCIADAGVYGLLTNGGDLGYDDNTWVTVTGHLAMTYDQQLGRPLPTLMVDSSSAISPPKNPYVYRRFY